MYPHALFKNTTYDDCICILKECDNCDANTVWLTCDAQNCCRRGCTKCRLKKCDSRNCNNKMVYCKGCEIMSNDAYCQDCNNADDADDADDTNRCTTCNKKGFIVKDYGQVDEEYYDIMPATNKGRDICIDCYNDKYAQNKTTSPDNRIENKSIEISEEKHNDKIYALCSTRTDSADHKSQNCLICDKYIHVGITQCNSCKGSMCNGCVSRCNKCHINDICGLCNIRCVGCYEKICDTCTIKCGCEYITLCGRCQYDTKCNNCLKFLCNFCSIKSKSNKDIYCNDCQNYLLKIEQITQPIKIEQSEQSKPQSKHGIPMLEKLIDCCADFPLPDIAPEIPINNFYNKKLSCSQVGSTINRPIAMPSNGCHTTGQFGQFGGSSLIKSAWLPKVANYKKFEQVNNSMKNLHEWHTHNMNDYVISKSMTCGMCNAQQSESGNHFCDLQKCDSCNKYMCDFCKKKCNLCQTSNICKMCIDYCDDCGTIVCYECMKICACNNMKICGCRYSMIMNQNLMCINCKVVFCDSCVTHFDKDSLYCGSCLKINSSNYSEHSDLVRGLVPGENYNNIEEEIDATVLHERECTYDNNENIKTDDDGEGYKFYVI